MFNFVKLFHIVSSRLQAFSKAFCRVSLPVVKKEKWAIETLSQYKIDLAKVWEQADQMALTVISEQRFRDSLKAFIPSISGSEMDIITMLAPKNLRGDIAYKSFIEKLGFNSSRRQVTKSATPAPPPGLPPLPNGMPAPVLDFVSKINGSLSKAIEMLPKSETLTIAVQSTKSKSDESVTASLLSILQI